MYCNTLHQPTESIQINSDHHSEPNTSEKFLTQNKSSGATTHNFHNQTLQIYHFLILIEPEQNHQSVIRLQITLTKFKVSKL